MIRTQRCSRRLCDSFGILSIALAVSLLGFAATASAGPTDPDDLTEDDYPTLMNPIAGTDNIGYTLSVGNVGNPVSDPVIEVAKEVACIALYLVNGASVQEATSACGGG